jgi:hypothetical protein
MKRWAATTLRPDRARTADVDDGFWDDDQPEFLPLLPMVGGDGRRLSVESMPDDIASPWERAAVAAGAVEVTPAEAAVMVRDIVEYRRDVAMLAETLPRWLAGHDRAEVTRRLRSAIRDRTRLAVMLSMYTPPMSVAGQAEHSTGTAAARATPDDKPTQRTAGRKPVKENR